MRLLATTSSDKTVKLWNLDGFKLERTLEVGIMHNVIHHTVYGCSPRHPPHSVSVLATPSTTFATLVA